MAQTASHTIAWDGPHFGNPPSTGGVSKTQETMRPMDQEGVGCRMMANMGWDYGTPLGSRGEGILNPLTDTIKNKNNNHGLGYTPPKTDANIRWDIKNMKIEDYEQSIIDSYMLDKGPFITDEEQKILEEMNAMDALSIECGDDRISALMGMDVQDMGDFEDMCNMKEAYHLLLAKSPQDGGKYCKYATHPTGPNRELQMGWGWFIDIPNFNSLRKRQSKKGLLELDEKNRIMADVKITNRGPKYFQGVSKYGKVYIDLKFTRYVPPVGGTMNCIIGLNGRSGMNWKVYRIPR